MKHVCKIWLGLDLILLVFVAAAYGNYKYETNIHNKKASLTMLQQEALQENAKEKKKQQGSKPIALTFDDGPHPVYTPLLLDGLKERGVKASFFLLGSAVELYPDIVKRMEAEGHLIGNHSYSHVQLTALPKEKACEEIQNTSLAIEKVIGHEVDYIRPPFGSWSDDLECSVDMFPVMWTIDPLDWTTKNTDKVVLKVLKGAKENGIILLHDSYESSVLAALRIIDSLTEEGYEFVTVDELIAN